jgi:hypothetical protein
MFISLDPPIVSQLPLKAKKKHSTNVDPDLTLLAISLIPVVHTVCVVFVIWGF